MSWQVQTIRRRMMRKMQQVRLRRRCVEWKSLTL
jgi:hypothetical protein